MKIFIVSCLLALAVEASTLPANKEAPKFPKKFDDSVHSIGTKKTNPKDDSSYASYVETKERDGMRIPSEFYQQGPYTDLVRMNPGLTFNPHRPNPKFTMTAPVEDSYSNPEGISMEGLRLPMSVSNPESNSYTMYAIDDEGRVQLLAPASSSYYSMFSLKQLEGLVSQSESAPSESMLPPSDFSPPSEVIVDSSYMAYDSNSDSSYNTYEQPEEGTGEKLRPPSISA